jgi:preprotein translocase subunit YajC
MVGEVNAAFGQLSCARDTTAGTLGAGPPHPARQKELSLSLLLILVLLFAVMWLLVIRPQRRRQAEQRRMLDELSPGQEVITAGGMYGTVHEVVGEDEVLVEIAPDVQVRLTRGAIAAVLNDEDEELTEVERAQEEAKKELLAARDAGES